MRSEFTSLVVGCDGTIGSALIADLKRDVQPIVGTTRRRDAVSHERRYLDLADEPSNWELPQQVEVAYLCAAVTSLETCRLEPTNTALVNVERSAHLARQLVERGAFVVFPSTNLVFDGRSANESADAMENPQTEYGRQKANAERALLQLGNQVSIVRFAKILPSDFPLFKQWADKLTSGGTIRPFSDMSIAPVPLNFAIRVLRCVADKRISGIVQVSGDRDVSYAEVAIHLARRLNVSERQVQPISAAESDRSFEAIPAHTTLDTRRLRNQLQLDPPDVWATIDAACGLS